MTNYMLIFKLHLPHEITNSMQALHALSHSYINANSCYISTVDDLEKMMHNEMNEFINESAPVSSDNDMAILPIQANSDVTEAAAKKARKEDNRKRKDTRIAAVNKMAANIFGVECVKCKALTEELFSSKSKLEMTERQLILNDLPLYSK